ncbi:hypothetical protein [Indiicoccus explosivorum]|uniref:hypothetical protein n=1 Tax=Indiicoccus explosivorum TaxID=1917864 RepID=UPI0013DE4B5C|nr:hypothetical protein [Indiicoccus explosivorum]
MKLSKIRSVLYLSARILGDISAVKNGTIHKRVARRTLGKAAGRIIGKIIK